MNTEFDIARISVCYQAFKRVCDFLFALFAFVILSPFFLFLACQIRKKLGNPVFFRQTRPGLHGKPFEMIKFRTMRDAIAPNGQPLPDPERLTSFGRSLRATSLDELPELFNVLKGDMSLVGPRPLLMEYLTLYTYEQARRHDVRPGITGWAQINGRNAISWEEKFHLDLWYIDNVNFFLDLKILFATVNKVISRQNINTSSGDMMPRFTGSERTP